MRIEGMVVAIAIVVGVFILGLSLISLYNDFITERDIQYLIVDLIFFGFGLLLLCGSLKIYKRLLMLSVATESIFEDVMYRRLKPLIDMVASGAIDLNEVKTMVTSLEKRLDKMEETLTKPAEVAVPERIVYNKSAFYMRTVITLFVFLGIYNFYLSYTVPYEPYLYTILYIIWWVFVTMEFNMFHKVEAWVVFGIPILIVPSSSLIMIATIGYTPSMGIIFATSLIYAYLYYIYAKSLSSGKKGGNFLNEKMKEGFGKIVRWFKS